MANHDENVTETKLDINRDILFECRNLKQFIDLSKTVENSTNRTLLDDTLRSKKMLKYSNTFLGRSDNVRFYVFDLPKNITCPGKTKICSQWCYQISLEKMHKDPQNIRDSTIVFHRKCNLYLSLRNDFVENMYKEIMRRRPGVENVIIRIHASGDFYNEEYLCKWLTIARAVQLSGKNYLFVAYTKSFKILDNVLLNKENALKKAWDAANELAPKKCSLNQDLSLSDFKNFKIIGSIMPDTKPEDMKIIKNYNLFTYEVINKNSNQDSFDCSKECCAKCLKCYDINSRTKIVTKLR